MNNKELRRQIKDEALGTFNAGIDSEISPHIAGGHKKSS